MRYSIKVEQKHIDRGRRNSAHYCPVALAVIECLRIRATVLETKIVLSKPKPRGLLETMSGSGQQQRGGMWGLRSYAEDYDEFSFTTPYEVRSVITRFDGGGLMLPFSFTLEIPPEIL